MPAEGLVRADSDLALELLTYLSTAVNPKEAYLRLLDYCRVRLIADAAGIFRRSNTRGGFEILLHLGQPFSIRHSFSTIFPSGMFLEKQILQGEEELLFEGSRTGINLVLTTPSGLQMAIRIEWMKPEAVSPDQLQKIQSVLPYVAPLLDHFKKYESHISVSTPVETRSEDLDVEWDTPDLQALYRKVFSVLAASVKLEAILFFLPEASGALVLEPGGSVGKVEPMPSHLTRSKETNYLFEALATAKPVFGGPAEMPKHAVAVPIAYKGEVLGIAALLTGSRNKLLADDLGRIERLLGQSGLFVKKALLYRRSKAQNPNSPLLLVGVPRDILELAEAYADAEAPILIRGETGTGKESIARFIHQIGIRRHSTFLPFNCAELVENLAESQLFGHVRGAFTGADRDSVGLFEQADGGTLFLDEIHLITLQTQAKFLRVIETSEIRPVGSSAPPKRLNVRIVVATNRDLQQLVSEEKFLHDLFMRLDVLEISLAPLRENRSVLPKIAQALLVEVAARNGKMAEGLTPRAKQALLKYDYPGNIRELKNILEKAVLMTQGAYVDIDAIPKRILEKRSGEMVPADFDVNFEHYKRESERVYLLKLLERAEGSVSEAARLAGVHRTHVYNLMKKHDLSADRFKA